MGHEFARFRDERRIAVEGGVSFAGGFSGRIMRVTHVRNSNPLGFLINAREALITGVSQFQKTIRMLLDGRRSRDQWEQEYEKK